MIGATATWSDPPEPVRGRLGLGAVAILLVGLLGAWGMGPQCGGRILVAPFCSADAHLCEMPSGDPPPWCCGDAFACGTTANGCPAGTCCPLATEPDYDASYDPGGWQYVPPEPGTTGSAPASSITPRQQ